MFLSRVELSERAARHPTFWREVSSPYGAHQALWALLSRSADHRRDFIYRAEERVGRPSFLVLSKEKPEAPADGLWDVESKNFAPALMVGQRLGFRLRASPVVRRGERVEGRENRVSHRHDVVMDLAHRRRRDHKAAPGTAALVYEAGSRWLETQGKRYGFKIATSSIDVVGDDGLLETAATLALRVEAYRQHRILRRGESPIRFSTLDFEGVLEVTDPIAMIAKVTQGFGPQKAFGCGLMLLRRT